MDDGALPELGIQEQLLEIKRKELGNFSLSVF